MSLCIAVASERPEKETRVALTPEVAGRLAAGGPRVLVEQGAGLDAGFSDDDYAAAGAEPVSARQLASDAELLLCVGPPRPERLADWRRGLMLVGFLDPLRRPELVRQLCDQGDTAFALELLPRSARAQAMDALSSQRSLAGYRAVLLAATRYGRFLPMLTTPTGTVRPARVLVVGAGVAGLQAIATAKRLGAMVEAFDVRAAAREQVESLGARFLDSGLSAEVAGGYARELDAEEKQRQQEFLAKAVEKSNVLITTAEIPGRPAPRIVSSAMSGRMKAGSVIIDLAAASGGNCEATKPGTWSDQGGVQVYGPLNAAAEMAPQASELYARNLARMLDLLVRDGALQPDWEDDIVRACCICERGEPRGAVAPPQAPGDKNNE